MTQDKPIVMNRIFMIAGEASGDLHGAKLARALLRENKDLKLEGVGGNLMRAAGVELLSHIDDLAVVGVVEVLGHWKAIWKTYRMISRRLREIPPGLIIFIDYPDFNLRVARIARRMNIPSIYYISPQVWAWRSGRVKTIAELIDKMLVIFPFEKELYATYGMDCEFVGHPLLDDLKPIPARQVLRDQLGLDPLKVTVGLLPGSRRQEVARLLPPMLKAMERLKLRLPDLQLVLAAAPSLDQQVIRSLVDESGLNVLLVNGKADEVICASDAAIVASGTATLQAAIHETPMVIVYKVSPLTYWIGKMLIRTDHIGLANVVAEQRVAPELLQSQVTGEKIVTEIYQILTDAAYRDRMKKGLVQVRERLGSPGASAKAARAVLNFLERRPAGSDLSEAVNR